jgi:hypothetical protein
MRLWRWIIYQMGVDVMNPNIDRTANQAAYRRLKDTLAQQYGSGCFIAFAEGGIIADAIDFDQLRSLLALQNRNPAHVLIVQAGVDHPENAVIFYGDRKS